jgi:hypothetical protein
MEKRSKGWIWLWRRTAVLVVPFYRGEAASPGVGEVFNGGGDGLFHGAGYQMQGERGGEATGRWFGGGIEVEAVLRVLSVHKRAARALSRRQRCAWEAAVAGCFGEERWLG